MELSYVVLLLRAKMSLVISVTDVTDRLVPRVLGPVFFIISLRVLSLIRSKIKDNL